MALAIGCNNAPAIYDPLCGEGYYILTPATSDAPRFNGAEVYGVRPSSPILYSISVTGARPMEFAAEGLPAGLSLDKENGIITGVINDKNYKGDYTVKLTAKNSKGVAERDLVITVGEKICLTPPMGWSSWIATKKTVTQDKVMTNARALESLGLDNYGYNYVNIDDAWQGAERGGTFNAIQPNLATFPDIKHMVDTLHSMGFKAGIYSTPWVTSYAGFIGGSSDNEQGKWDTSLIFDKRMREIEGTCSTLGKYKFDDNDAAQWADWGFDYMKYDWNPNDSVSIINMAKALRNSGRDIAFSISNSCPVAMAKLAGEYVQVIRTNGDIRARWNTAREHINLCDNWEHHNNWLENGFAGSPGHIPDPDFLMVGLQGYGTDVILTADELYHHMSSFVLWGGPLLISCELENMSEFELSLLTNVEMLDLNQDRLADCASRVYNQDGIQVLVKELYNGDKAIGIFNFNEEATVATVDWSTLGLSGKQMLRDVWRQSNIGKYSDSFSANIPSHGVVVVRASAL